MGRLCIARRFGSWITCIVGIAFVGWAIASCTFPEYAFSETDAGLSASVNCRNGDDCQAGSCGNSLKDETETDIDCGGDCNACDVGKGCALGKDCAQGVCIAQVCAAATCDDRVKNASESDVDCGGPACPKCAADQKCVIPTDCISGDCAKGACTPTCADGLASCDGDPANGCETNVRTDPNHCGGCGTTCKLPNAVADCAGSICRVASCAAGFADCNGDPMDGCEVNIKTDKINCGACGKICPSVNGQPYCAEAACQITCTTGFGDCDDDRGNGCEKDVSRDVQNCGKCGTVCPATQGGTPWCKSNMCGETVCPSGKGDCNGDPADGCETDLTTDAKNCKTCGNLCVVSNGTAKCNNTVCTIDKCTAPNADCSGGYANGCETNTDTDLAHCGKCGNACSIANGAAKCVTGMCQVKSCSSPYSDCNGMPGDGCEINLSNNQTNCGGCGAAGKNCNAAYSNATSHCQTSGCAFDACAPNYKSCNTDLGDGCEINIATDLANCGDCDVKCATLHAALGTSCSAKACHPQCDAGWKDCTNSAAGCTTPLGTANNCLACGDACGATKPFCTVAGCADHLDISVVNSGLGFASGTPSASCNGMATQPSFCWDGSKTPAGTVMHALATAAGNYRMVLVGVASQVNLREPVSVTYNGAPMAYAVRQASTEDGSWAGIYYILEAALPMSAGSYPVTVTYSNQMLWGAGIFDVVEFKNVHQMMPFVTTAATDISDNCPIVRAIPVNFSQVGSFVYALTAAANGSVSGGRGTSTTPVGFVETLNLGVGFPNPAFLAGMAGYVGPVDSNQTFTWSLANCYNSASVGVAIHRMSVP